MRVVLDPGQRGGGAAVLRGPDRSARRCRSPAGSRALPAPQLARWRWRSCARTPDGEPPDRGAISFGFRNALRALAADGPLLVAVDDLQWLDAPSGDALAFAARRLDDSDRVASCSPGGPAGLLRVERALAPLKRLEVGPLSLGATRRMLAERLGAEPAAPASAPDRRRHAGQPVVRARAGPQPRRRGPACDRRRAARARCRRTPARQTGGAAFRAGRAGVLLAVALSGDLREGQVAALADLGALDDAVHAGVVVVDGGRARAAHPLLAAAAAKQSPRTRAAGAALRARRRGRGRRASCPAPGARRRGSGRAARPSWSPRPPPAPPPGEPCARLPSWASTRCGSPRPTRAERPERVLALAHYLGVAGERQRLTDLLTAELEELPPGSPRVRACLLLPGGVVRAQRRDPRLPGAGAGRERGPARGAGGGAGEHGDERGRDPGRAGTRCRGVG